MAKNKFELKPCPFCNGRAEIEKIGATFYGHCTICGANGTGSYSMDFAVDAWNRRRWHHKEGSAIAGLWHKLIRRLGYERN